MPSWAKLRKAGALTQHRLGGLAKVGRSKIANVETGRAEFTPAERQRILAVLAVSIGQTVAELNTSLASDGAVAH
jgi:transcriptional regulator with XRE-family HTH domain